MSHDILTDIRRVGIDHFDPDPRNVGGACILRDPELFEKMGALADWPAAWKKEPSSERFSEAVLSFGDQLFDRSGWDVVPHFVLATEMGNAPSPLHTDWEGVTFADPSTFTLWAPQSHFGEPHLMLFHAEFWPPPHCEFFLDESGLYARTMLRDGIYRRYSGCDRLGLLEIKLQEGEVLAFNGTIPHRTHPDTPQGRRSVNVRCPSNRGTRAEPKVHVNVTSPFGRGLLRNKKSFPINHILRGVDARITPKGYFELGPSVSSVERRARIRRFVKSIRGLGRFRARILRSGDR